MTFFKLPSLLFQRKKANVDDLERLFMLPEQQRSSPVSEKIFSAGNAENSRIKLILAIIFLIALISRFYFLKRFIEYDEIWSLLNYSVLNVGQIFSDFSLPNNHPVNTLLIKLLYFSRENAWTIRLGSLAFSLASVWLLYDIGRRTAGKKSACYAALAGAVMPPLVMATAI
jgi:4-amino-4-deoxy-L-arabinose transferase-like glycosyltransferase